MEKMRSDGLMPNHCTHCHRDGVAKPHGPGKEGKGERAQAEEQERRTRGEEDWDRQCVCEMDSPQRSASQSNSKRAQMKKQERREG
jgi:hypothetical protein